MLFLPYRLGEHIDVAKLVLGCGEVFHLHQALFRQRLQAVVQAAHAHTQPLCQFTLREVWVLLQDAHHPEIRVFLKFGLATCHKVDEFFVRCRFECVLGRLPHCRITQVSAAARQTNTSATGVTDTAKKLDGVSRELRNLIARFRITRNGNA